ncbi:MAG TPA: HTH domain-containing protein [bacterium]|jgi:hypothetical protein
MSNLILDYRAIGLNPRWEDILIEIIDLELGYAHSPRLNLIMKYIMEGYSTVEIGKKIGVSKRTIIRDIGKIRQVSAL